MGAKSIEEHFVNRIEKAKAKELDKKLLECYKDATIYSKCLKKRDKKEFPGFFEPISSNNYHIKCRIEGVEFEFDSVPSNANQHELFIKVDSKIVFSLIWLLGSKNSPSKEITRYIAGEWEQAINTYWLHRIESLKKFTEAYMQKELQYTANQKPRKKK